MIKVEVIETIDAKYVRLGDTLTCSREEALKLAAHLVYLVKGDLILSICDGRVSSWNTDSEFFQLYQNIQAPKS